MKNRLLLISFFSLFFFTYLANAQSTRVRVNIDSLFHVLTPLPNTKEKVDKLIDLYKKSIKQGNTRKDIIDEALTTAEKINYNKGIAIAYNRKGITARYEQEFHKSVMFHKQALSYFAKTNDTFYKSKCYNSLGVTYRKLNLEKEAFENYLQALKLSEQLNKKRGISISLNGIGNVFLNTEQYDKALHYFKRALKVEIEQDNHRGQEYGYANIGEVYLAKKQFDSAYYYFNKSYKIAIKHPRKESIAIKHTLFGKLYQKKGEYKKSLEEYTKSLPDLKKYKNKRYLSKALINIGIDELHLEQYKKAYMHVIGGLSLARKINSKENITLGYEALVEYYSLTKDYKKALKAHKQAKVFHDSIVNIASQKSIISTQIAYETAEKDKEIKKLAIEKELIELKSKNNFNRFIITAIVSLISIAFLLIFLYLYRRNSDLEMQQKNAELQNYILKISELKDQAQNHNTTDKDISEKFKEFKLSKREIEVLTHISNGLNNEEISEKMFVSKNTIKTHITHIYAKLDVKNRIQAIQKITNS
jgi:ATP/maltotriose-dependent transcriptional regulator MalT